MPIAVGESIPNEELMISGNETELNACAVSKKVSSVELFGKGKVVLFGVPGAFTPTCHLSHLPGYVKEYEQFKQKGVDLVACVSTNDIYVLDAWGKHENASGKVKMVSDGNGKFSEALGVATDLARALMGTKRTSRFAAILEDGVVKYFQVGNLDVSGAEAVLAKL